MLNPFPIQFLAPLAYFILRITIGSFFVRHGIRMVKHPSSPSFLRTAALIEILIGSMFILGWNTQYAALGALTLVLLSCLPSVRAHIHMLPSRSTLFFTFSIAVSLFITGGGPFGFDLPI